MKDLFSDAGLDALQRFSSHNMLCAFDLDGTLAPISPEPDKIEVSGEIQHELLLLMQYIPVAIITGRSRREAMRFLDITPHYLIGNHGSEGLDIWKSAEARFITICQEWKKQLLQQLETSDVGILLEDKGTSVSIHYRHAPDHEKAIWRLQSIIRQLLPLPRVVGGKCVLNLIPENAPNKGDALLELLQLTGKQQALFVGDDVTDEDVFALKRQQVFSIRVGNDDASQADWYVSTQGHVLRLLEELRICLQRHRSF